MKKFESREDYIESLRDCRNIHHRDVLLETIKSKKLFTQEQINEYVDEAEHQDGYEYWLNFKTYEDLVFDICEYYDVFQRLVEGELN